MVDRPGRRRPSLQSPTSRRANAADCHLRGPDAQRKRSDLRIPASRVQELRCQTLWCALIADLTLEQPKYDCFHDVRSAVAYFQANSYRELAPQSVHLQHLFLSPSAPPLSTASPLSTHAAPKMTTMKTFSLSLLISALPPSQPKPKHLDQNLLPVN